MKGKILFIGRLPPPIHGAANANKMYIESKLLNDNFQIKKIQINLPDDLKNMGKINIRRFMWTINSYLKLLLSLIFFNPNLIYFEIAPKGFAFIRDSFYVILCKIFNKKILFHSHAKGFNESINNYIMKKYYKFILGNSKFIISSRFLYPDMNKIVERKNVYILKNGINDPLNKDFNEVIKNRNKNRKIFLLFLSNMIESKGPLEVIKICDSLNKENISFECNFVGDFKDNSFKKEFQKSIKENKLHRKCFVLGPKYGADKLKILEKSTHLVFPTFYPEETSPAVILEAFAMGIPVFSYDNGGIREMVSNKELGSICEKNDWKGLSKQIKNSLNRKYDPKKIRAYFLDNYSYRCTMDSMLKIWKKELN